MAKPFWFVHLICIVISVQRTAGNVKIYVVERNCKKIKYNLKRFADAIKIIKIGYCYKNCMHFVSKHKLIHYNWNLDT